MAAGTYRIHSHLRDCLAKIQTHLARVILSRAMRMKLSAVAVRISTPLLNLPRSGLSGELRDRLTAAQRPGSEAYPGYEPTQIAASTPRSENSDSAVPGRIALAAGGPCLRRPRPSPSPARRLQGRRPWLAEDSTPGRRPCRGSPASLIASQRPTESIVITLICSPDTVLPASRSARGSARSCPIAKDRRDVLYPSTTEGRRIWTPPEVRS
jgi:hypothetical protein